MQQCWTFRVCLNFGWNSKITSGPCSDQAARDFAFCCQRKSIQSILISIYINTSFRHLTAMAAILKEPLHRCDWNQAGGWRASCWEGCPWSSVGRHSIWDLGLQPSSIAAYTSPHLAQSSSPASASQWTPVGKKKPGEVGCLVMPFQSAQSAMYTIVYFLNFRLHPEICHFNPLQPVILMAAASQFVCPSHNVSCNKQHTAFRPRKAFWSIRPHDTVGSLMIPHD